MFDRLKQMMSIWMIRKIQKFGPHSVQVLGRNYRISDDVFNPKYFYTSEFMAEHMEISVGDNVLDMGTGSGIQAIAAAERARKVTAVDISQAAVSYAKENVLENGLEDRISVQEGDLFSSLAADERFDVIIFTPPYLNGIPKTSFDRALFDNDKELVGRFFAEADSHLKPGGNIQMVYSSIAHPEDVLRISHASGWRDALVARKKLFLEEFYMYRFIRGVEVHS